MNAIPPGKYRTNSAGHLVPEELIDEIDKLRDEVVQDIVREAEGLHSMISNFKRATFSNIQSFMELSAERYDVTWGGTKGNVQLTSYDGRYRVELQVRDRIAFNEQLQIAKQLIDQCIHRWAEGSSAKIRALIEHAFQTDKMGRINTDRVLSLTKLKIEDADWQHAMDALQNSVSVVSTARYMRIYKRIGRSDQYKHIALDLAAIELGDDE
ncbi:MAG: sulfate transporter [Methylomonas sp.]|nr:MAG: sulfate transporter [Methylomonas sp.]